MWDMVSSVQSGNFDLKDNEHPGAEDEDCWWLIRLIRLLGEDPTQSQQILTELLVSRVEICQLWKQWKNL